MPAKKAPARLLRSLPSILLALPLLTACAGSQQRMNQAVFTGDTAAMENLLRSDQSLINTPVTLDQKQLACPDQSTLTPLQAAACAGQEAIVRMLLANKADIDLALGAGQPPLLLALANGHDSIVRLLVQSGARIESTDAAGNTALMLAAQQENEPLAEFLLQNGASLQARNQAGDTALLLCPNPGMAKMLVDQGSNPLDVNARGESGLHRAAKNGNAKMVRFFLEQGVDCNLRSRSGQTALDLARASRDGEAAAVIEQWFAQSLQKELTAGDQAAQQGRFDEALAAYVAALSRAQEIGGSVEQNLRVQIVRFAASMPQPPALPEKANEHLVRGSYMLKKGQDIGQVEKEIAAALSLAPWWVEGYFNLGQLQAEQKKLDQAERNLKLFIAAAPADPRAQAVQNKIVEIGVDREENQKIQGMQGRWVDAGGRGYAVSINGEKMLINSDTGLAFTLTLKNGVIEGSVEGKPYPGDHRCTIPGQIHPVNGKISPDARQIAVSYLWSAFKTNFHCVNMMGVPSNCCLTCDEVCDSVTISSTSQMSLQLKPVR